MQFEEVDSKLNKNLSCPKFSNLLKLGQYLVSSYYLDIHTSFVQFSLFIRVYSFPLLYPLSIQCQETYPSLVQSIHLVPNLSSRNPKHAVHFQPLDRTWGIQPNLSWVGVANSVRQVYCQAHLGSQLDVPLRSLLRIGPAHIQSNLFQFRYRVSELYLLIKRVSCMVILVRCLVDTRCKRVSMSSRYL